MDALASNNGAPVAKKNRTWIWYFVILAVLSTAATTTLIVFNLGQQLTPEKLESARQLWKERGPDDYDMEYTKQTSAVESLETYRVEVRNGKVVKVTMTPGPAGKNTQWKSVEERLYPYHSVPAIFGFMRDFFEQDRRPGQPRAFVTAVFADDDGHPMRYVRSIGGEHRQRVEIIVPIFTRLPK